MKTELINLHCDNCSRAETFHSTDSEKWNKYTEFEVKALNSNGVYSAPIMLCRQCFDADSRPSRMARVLTRFFNKR